MPKKKNRIPPEPGCVFQREYKAKTYEMLVVLETGQISYKVGAVVYRSPSAAAKSVTNTEVNGWSFWEID